MKQPGHDFRHAPRERLLSRVNKVLIVLTVAVALVPLIYRLMPGTDEKKEQERMLREIQEKLDSAQMMQNRLKSEVTMLQNGGELLGIYARDGVEPGYMAEGETIFRLPPKR